MIRRILKLYQQYQEYIRVDLLMYGVLLFLILGYVVFSLIIS